MYNMAETTTPFLRGLQPMNNDDDDNDSTSHPFIDDQFGLFVFCISGSIALVVAMTLMIREYYWKKYAIDVCPGLRGPRTSRGGSQPHTSQQINRDRELAQELQRELNEEERDVEREAKRKERRTWYEAFIKPYTMVSYTVLRGGRLARMDSDCFLFAVCLIHFFLL
jgi:hypothetical protein